MEMSLGTLLTVWKAFHYSHKRAEILAEIEAVLNTPEIKITKPSGTQWLAKPSGKFFLL